MLPLLPLLACTDPDRDATDGGLLTPDTGSTCVPEPVEADASLTLSPLGSWQATPGAVRDAVVYAVNGAAMSEPVTLCPTWSVSPDDGVVRVVGSQIVVADDAPDGATATVTASIPAANAPGGDALELELPVFVYEPALRPWVGTWHELTQIDCETGAERSPERPIEEIRIDAAGILRVTWAPFELYVDWWGEQTFTPGADPSAGTVEIEVTGGNYVPTDIVGSGSYRIESAARSTALVPEAPDQLVLDGVWLGSPQDATQPAGCGHRLQ
ncbi:MAG: hypothetical protein R3F59_17540 [Myxococcota bacterium]